MDKIKCVNVAYFQNSFIVDLLLGHVNLILLKKITAQVAFLGHNLPFSDGPSHCLKVCQLAIDLHISANLYKMIEFQSRGRKNLGKLSILYHCLS